MKFIFLFIILINSAWAINDISECLNPGRTIGTNYERPADIILLVPGTGTRGTILTLGHFGNLGGYFEQIENLFLSFFLPMKHSLIHVSNNKHPQSHFLK